MVSRVKKRKTCCFWITKSFFLLILIALPFVAKSYFIADDEVYTIHDSFQQGLQPLNQFLHKHQSFTKFLIILSGLLIDFYFIFTWSVWLFRGNSSRPVLAWMFVLIIQFLSQICGWFYPSKDIYWKYPGFPSLLLNYHATTAVFFSTDISFLTIANFQLSQKGKKLPLIIGITIQIFISFVFIITNRHYYAGVLFGFLTAHLCLILVRKFDQKVDNLFAKVKQQKQQRTSQKMQLSQGEKKNSKSIKGSHQVSAKNDFKIKQRQQDDYVFS